MNPLLKSLNTYPQPNFRCFTGSHSFPWKASRLLLPSQRRMTLSVLSPHQPTRDATESPQSDGKAMMWDLPTRQQVNCELQAYLGNLKQFILVKSFNKTGACLKHLLGVSFEAWEMKHLKYTRENASPTKVQSFWTGLNGPQTLSSLQECCGDKPSPAPTVGNTCSAAQHPP